MPAVLDEIVEKIEQLSDEEKESLIHLLQGRKNKARKNGEKGFVHPNTIWIKEHHAEYAGKYVALKDGQLIATGADLKEAEQAAKEKGVEDSMLTYLFPLDEEPFGGW